MNKEQKHYASGIAVLASGVVLMFISIWFLIAGAAGFVYFILKGFQIEYPDDDIYY